MGMAMSMTSPGMSHPRYEDERRAFVSGEPFSDDRTDVLQANTDSRNWPDLKRQREAALDAVVVAEAARNGKQLEPKWTEAVAFPSATEPFVLIDARGSMYRIDPKKGSYRPLWAEQVNPRAPTT